MTTTMPYSARIRSGGAGTRRAGRAAKDRERDRGQGRDRGQVALEYLGFLPLLLLVAMGALQLGLAAYAANQAGTAARAGARTAASYDAHGDPQSTARSAVSGWLGDGGFRYSQRGGRDITATVQVKVPSVVPGLDGWWAKRSATMPRE
ncbi:TadE/TadG family type IV pilus assembly protein [Streptomyces cyaneofuscatus]